MSDDLSPDNPGPSPNASPERELDELLSADLDGELDAAARDLGLSIDDARAIINEPGADSRRRALAAARDRIAQVPEIDELVAQRLRAKAVHAAEAEQHEQAAVRRQRRRTLAGVGTVAATIVAVAAVAVGLNTHGSDSGSSKAASAPVVAPAPVSSTTAAPKAAARTGLLALGSFADVRTLGEAAVVQAATAPLSAPPHDGAPVEGTNTTPAPAASGATATSSVPASADGPAFSNENQEVQTAAQACTSPPPGATGDRLVLHATASLAGEPVIVLVFAGAGEHVVVIDRPNCTLVNLQQLR